MGSRDATGTARHAAAEGGRSGRRAEDSQGFGVLIMAGLIVYGVVHLLLVWIILQLAWAGGSGRPASQRGALSELAGGTFGSVLLWVVGVGLFVLVAWQLSQVFWGYGGMAPAKRLRRRAASVGSAVVFAAIGVSAVGIALGSGSQSGGGSGAMPLTARLMSHGWGRVLVVVIGLIIIAVGIGLIYRGLAKRFVEGLRGSPSGAAIRFGQIGFTAKGAVLILVGVLFAWAAIAFDPSKAGGLDSALRTLRNQPYGPVVLTLIAAGLACFGCYCFAWSRHAQH